MRDGKGGWGTVSDSFMHFSVHSASCAQDEGSWASSPHRKQNGYEQEQRTVVTPDPIATESAGPYSGLKKYGQADRRERQHSPLSHRGAGQYFIFLLTYENGQ